MFTVSAKGISSNNLQQLRPKTSCAASWTSLRHSPHHTRAAAPHNSLQPPHTTYMHQVRGGRALPQHHE